MSATNPKRSIHVPSVDRQEAIRSAWVRYWKVWHAHVERYPDSGSFPPAPAVFGELRCGALNRAGEPCGRRDLYSCGRCRLHGGLSSGPKTDEGKSRSSANGARGGRPPKTKPHEDG